MRLFSLLFAFISLVLLAELVIYVLRGPVDPLIAAAIFAGFLFSLIPTLYLLKPFEPPEELKRRRERRRARKGSSGGRGS